MERTTFATLCSLALALAISAHAGELTFVGAACSGAWRTDLYLVGDASGAPGPQQVTLTYLPFGEQQQEQSVTVTVAGGEAEWRSTALDVVCDLFPGADGTTGVLTVDVPFDVTGWARTWSPPGYGQALMPAEALEYAREYAAPEFGDGYHCNLLVYNPDGTYAILTVGNDYLFLEPREALVVARLAPTTHFQLVSGGRVQATLSLVYEETADAVTVPLTPLP